MRKTVAGEPVTAGDVVEITGHSVGDQPRTAEVIEVPAWGARALPRRWEDGHESVFFGDDAACATRAAAVADRSGRASRPEYPIVWIDTMARMRHLRCVVQALAGR
jgi:hypothetical protein